MESVMTPFSRFWNLMRLYKFELRQIYAYAIFNGIVNLTLPIGVQAIINYLQTGKLSSTWIILVCFVLFGILVSGIVQVLQIRVVENIQQDVFARSAFEFAYRIPKISFLQLDKIHAPELVNRFFDTMTIQKGLPKILIDFSLAIFQIVFGLILLAIYSPYFIILGFALAFILWLIFKFTVPQGLETSLKESKYKYSVAHWLEEVARTNRSFKMNPNSEFHINKTDGLVKRYVSHRENHFQVLLNQFRLFIGFKVILAAGLLVLGGFLVFQEQMNIGQFVAAEIIIILIINSVEKVIRVIDTNYDVLTALEKIGYVTDLKLDECEGTGIVNGSGGVSIRANNIEFGFPNDRKLIFDNLTFKINKNDKVALEGKSGSGKSILLQILAGIHNVTDGELYMNDIPYFSYDRDSLYNSTGMTFSVNQIFEGTFQENITLGKEIPRNRLEEVLEVLNLKDFINYQQKGILTILDSGGRRLPRSIIQKILIARMIVSEPKLLLMEDPLQFIDEEEKKRIVDYILSDERNWTVVIVSDFYYWKKKCNRVIELGSKI